MVIACSLALFIASCTSSTASTTAATAAATSAVTVGAASTVSTEAARTTDGGGSQVSSTGQTGPSVSTNASGQNYSALTGLPVASKDDVTKPVTGMMIDNLGPARPQSGIKDGEVIIEAIAEAGITRFLVLYQQNTPELIGPVRSLRVYDIDWAKAFDCSIGHVGGAPSALTEVRNGKYRDIDMLRNGAYYWRSTDRSAPHNVYTSSEKIAALNKAKNYAVSHPAPFSRTDGTPSENPDASSVSIHISSASYDSTYTYDEGANTYARYQGGKPFMDREAGQVTPSVVIALMVNEWRVREKSTTPIRERIGTIGSGKAVIFQNGTATQVTWNKPSQDAQLTFSDAAGNDVPLVRGQTWIVAVPNKGGSVSWH
jgi:Protein of unknown function (DUF3048) N-terminal domain/Protein of unknown function (DUF3048) C-terminal domain